MSYFQNSSSESIMGISYQIGGDRRETVSRQLQNSAVNATLKSYIMKLKLSLHITYILMLLMSYRMPMACTQNWMVFRCSKRELLVYFGSAVNKSCTLNAGLLLVFYQRGLLKVSFWANQENGVQNTNQIELQKHCKLYQTTCIRNLERYMF